MATLTRFEDLKVWQKARNLCIEIDKTTRKPEFSKDYKLKDQINGASGSIMDNIAEGFERCGRNEFIQFLSIAKGSAGETRSQLYRALDKGYISEEKFRQLYEDTNEISKMLKGLITYLNGADVKGIKYKNRVEEPETPNWKLQTPNWKLETPNF